MILLVLATSLSFINAHSTLIGKQILKWFSRPSTKEKELMSQKNDLKKIQNGVNITDNFAKYSKIQRQINNIDNELSELCSEKNSLAIQFGFTYGAKIILGTLLALLSIYFRSTPVLILDESIDLTPFNFLISYPHSGNVVSFHFWVLCSSATAQLLNL